MSTPSLFPAPGLALLRELLNAKGLLRTVQNLHCTKFELSGRVLDIGAKDGHASYMRFFRQSPGTEIVLADRFPPAPHVVEADLERALPFAAHSFDTVLAMNVLYLVYNLKNAFSEMARILKPGGTLIGSVPLLYKAIPEPIEYFRFSAAALERLAYDAGLQDIHVVPLGWGPLSTAASLVASVAPLPRVTAAGVYGAALCDCAITKGLGSRGDRYQNAAPLGFFFHARR